MLSRALLCSAFAGMFTAVCWAQTVEQQSTSAVDSESKGVFHRLNGYLTSGTLDFQTSYDARNATLGSSRGSAHFIVERPNLLRVEISGGGFSYLLISDGQLLTILDRLTKKFSQRPAPKTPLEALNLFTGLTASEAQVLRFISVVYNAAAEASDVKIKAGGMQRIGGRQCDRYDITYTRGTSPDSWEAYLESKDPPLPCKTVVKSADGSNVQTNVYTWNSKTLSPPPETYKFIPPTGSQKVEVGELGFRPLH